MIKVSNTHYITIKKYDYYGQPAITTGKKDGDRIEVFCFMSPNPNRFIWIERGDVLKE